MKSISKNIDKVPNCFTSVDDVTNKANLCQLARIRHLFCRHWFTENHYIFYQLKTALEMHIAWSTAYILLLNFYPCSSILSTFIHLHPRSSTFTHIHPLSSTFTHIHQLSSTFIHFHQLSSTFIQASQFPKLLLAPKELYTWYCPMTIKRQQQQPLFEHTPVLNNNFDFGDYDYSDE